MAKEIIWSDEAKAWLNDIYDYIAQDNEEAAWNTVVGIREKAAVLVDNPNVGYRHDEDNLPEDVRILLYGHYRIAYEAIEGQDIKILGIFHGALNMKRFLSRYH